MLCPDCRSAVSLWFDRSQVYRQFAPTVLSYRVLCDLFLFLMGLTVPCPTCTRHLSSGKLQLVIFIQVTRERYFSKTQRRREKGQYMKRSLVGRGCLQHETRNDRLRSPDETGIDLSTVFPGSAVKPLLMNGNRVQC